MSLFKNSSATSSRPMCTPRFLCVQIVAVCAVMAIYNLGWWFPGETRGMSVWALMWLVHLGLIWNIRYKGWMSLLSVSLGIAKRSLYAAAFISWILVLAGQWGYIRQMEWSRLFLNLTVVVELHLMTTLAYHLLFAWWCEAEEKSD